MSEEHRAKIAAANSGRHLTEEHKAKISANSGRRLSDEAKAKISAAKKGRHLSEETRAKISIANSGGNNPMYGKHRHLSEQTRAKLSANHRPKFHSEETKAKMSQAQRGKNHPMYDKHHSEETKLKMSIAHNIPWWIKRGLPNPGIYFTKPTKPEGILIRIIEEYHLPFKYVGNGQVILGGLNPDFININSKKQIIEVFGDYWHSRPGLEYHQTEEGRKEVYSQFGYTTMILWEHDMYSMRSGDIAKKLIQFEGTG